MSQNYGFHKKPKKRRARKFGLALLILVILLAGGFVLLWHTYQRDLEPVSKSQVSKTVTFEPGTSSHDIAKSLETAGLIRNSWAFDWYVRTNGLRGELEAGTYSLNPSQSTQQIAKILAKGKISTHLVTILPGQRLDQIRSTLINAGFSPSSVNAALQPDQYTNLPVMKYKPASANLEGLLYPDSFQKTADTTASDIVSESLTEMGQHLTPSIRIGFAKEGLTTYQGITLASVIIQEVSKPDDQAQAAQVFLKRLSKNMPLGSDVTAFYGAIIAGQTPSINYDSPYNTLIHKGLPPAPISNVDNQALYAAAHPADTDWLYFVSGDNGTTYFENTGQEHQADVSKYCHSKCAQDSQ